MRWIYGSKNVSFEINSGKLIISSQNFKLNENNSYILDKRDKEGQAGYLLFLSRREVTVLAPILFFMGEDEKGVVSETRAEEAEDDRLTLEQFRHTVVPDLHRVAALFHPEAEEVDSVVVTPFPESDIHGLTFHRN